MFAEDLTFPEIDADSLPDRPRLALLALREFVRRNPDKSINYSEVCRIAQPLRGKTVPVNSLKNWLKAAGIDLNLLPTSKGSQAKGGTPIALVGTRYSMGENARKYKREYSRKMVKVISGKDVKPRVLDD